MDSTDSSAKGIVAGNRAARRRAASRRGQKGLSLIETAAALGIVALMLVSFGKLTAENQVASRSRATAIQMQQVTAAAAQYMQSNYDTIKNQLIAGGSGAVVYVPVAEVDATAGGLDSIEKQGYLGATTARNPYGQKLALGVKIAEPATGGPPTSTPRLEGMILSYGGQDIPDAELGRIATSIGASGGFIPKAVLPGGGGTAQIQGAYGGWKSDPAAWTVGALGAPKSGHVASTLAFQVGVGESDYLSRYPVSQNEMHTNIAFQQTATSAFGISGAADIQSATMHTGDLTTQAVRGTQADSMLFSMDGKSIGNVGTITGEGAPGSQHVVINGTVLGQADSSGSRTLTFNGGDSDSVKINGGLATTNSISSQQDIAGQSLTASGYVVGGKMLDNTDGQVGYAVDPGGVTDIKYLAPSYLNVDTQIYGSTVNIGQKTNGKLFGLPSPSEAAAAAGCGLGDMACVNKAYDDAVKLYAAAVAAAVTEKPLTLGDLLPSMVARGLFVIGSDGNVTDGQAGSLSTVWSDGKGGSVVAPVLTAAQQPLAVDPTEGGEYGFVMQPNCGSGGVPQIYLSKFDDSTGFSMKINPDGTDLINVTTNYGGDQTGAAGGFTSNAIPSDANGPGKTGVAGGVRVHGYSLNGQGTTGTIDKGTNGVTYDPVVTGVSVGDGVNLAPSVSISTTIDGNNISWWKVLVSKQGEYQPDGTPGKVYFDGATKTYKPYITGTKYYNGTAWVPCTYDAGLPMAGQRCGHIRKVLAQTFCNYNGVRKDFAAGSKFP